MTVTGCDHRVTDGGIRHSGILQRLHVLDVLLIYMHGDGELSYALQRNTIATRSDVVRVSASIVLPVLSAAGSLSVPLHLDFQDFY